MRNILFLSLVISIATLSKINAQEAATYGIEVKETSWTGLPGLQSYAWGKDQQGRWLLVGGRKDGLHKRRPFEAFLSSGNNDSIFVVDPQSKKVSGASLNSLPTAVKEQLQSTNMQHEQVGSILYLSGGYAYSPTAADHITFDRLTVLNVDSITQRISAGQPFDSFVGSVQDTIMRVTGGVMRYQDSTFFIIGGQYFEGRYNPMGPQNGPGFKQVYNEGIRRFKVTLNGMIPVVSDYSFTADKDNLHRRDYNVLPQVFPNGERGFTAFSGVFQITADLPWLTSVDITTTSHNHRSDFSQYLSHYHCATLPIYDSQYNSMQTIFFGGISQFKVGTDGNLIEDQNVPFVKTISKVTRYSDNSMKESYFNEIMPGFLGSGAEFIPAGNYFKEGILDLSKLPMSSTLVGYIVGGIQSFVENDFFSNSPTSIASNKVFEVYVNTGTSSIENELTSKEILQLKLYPNPTNGKVNVEFWTPGFQKAKISVTDLRGMVILEEENISNGQELQLNLNKQLKGLYFIKLSYGNHEIVEKLEIF